MLTHQIIGAALRVHSRLGPGVLESSYEACLKYELEKRGLRVEAQIGLPLVYDEVHLELGYRLDLMVENEVIVEIKAQEATLPVHESQLLSHLRLSNRKVGLLINFHVRRLKDGIKRMVDFPEGGYEVSEECQPSAGLAVARRPSAVKRP
jgi:GxxExxY protein